MFSQHLELTETSLNTFFFTTYEDKIVNLTTGLMKFSRVDLKLPNVRQFYNFIAASTILFGVELKLLKGGNLNVITSRHHQLPPY